MFESKKSPVEQEIEECTKPLPVSTELVKLADRIQFWAALIIFVIIVGGLFLSVSFGNVPTVHEGYLGSYITTSFSFTAFLTAYVPCLLAAVICYLLFFSAAWALKGLAAICQSTADTRNMTAELLKQSLSKNQASETSELPKSST